MKRSQGGAWAAVAVLMVVGTYAGCVGEEPPEAEDRPLDATSPPADAPPIGDGLLGNGEVCQRAETCRSGFCTDGVCCETACDGVCEQCNQPGAAGSCSATPAGQDPARECVSLEPQAEEPPDAAVSVPSNVQFNQSLCAPTCNGQRACGYPSREVGCGTTFCGSTEYEGKAACDGRGNCQLTFDTCGSYQCEQPLDEDGGGAGEPGCAETCTTSSDCQAGHYCRGDGTCTALAANGAVCTIDAACESGHCVDGVCCNTQCSGGGEVCSTGTCECNGCGGQACVYFYYDDDGDGYGDPAIAESGCAGSPPTTPTPRWVTNNRDCHDGNNLVHPGQTQYFETPYLLPGGGTSFDYNCNGRTDGASERKYHSNRGAIACERCVNAPTGNNCQTPTACVSGTPGAAAFVCPRKRAGASCASEGVQQAFFEQVECGESGLLHECNSCLRPPPPSTTRQACR